MVAAGVGGTQLASLLTLARRYSQDIDTPVSLVEQCVSLLLLYLLFLTVNSLPNFSYLFEENLTVT